MHNRPNAVLLGAGGHALGLLEIAKLTGAANICGILDPGLRSEYHLGLPVWGDDSILPELTAKGITHFIIGVGSTRHSPIRRHLFEQACQASLIPLTLQHPASTISPSAKIGAGCQLMAGCIVGPEARIEEGVLLNSGAIAEHHTTIKAHSHVASGACLTGHVTVNAESFIGAGSVVRQSIQIGSRCTIGMGSVVLQDIPDDSVAYGSPAVVQAQA